MNTYVGISLVVQRMESACLCVWQGTQSSDPWSGEKILCLEATRPVLHSLEHKSPGAPSSAAGKAPARRLGAAAEAALTAPETQLSQKRTDTQKLLEQPNAAATTKA